MRIIAVSDTHGLHRQLRMPQGNVLLCAGDIAPVHLDDNIRLAQDAIDWLNEQPHEHIVFTAGNHDSIYYRHHFDWGRIINLSSGSVRLNGLKFAGVGWGHKLDFDACDVLLTHEPPFGTLDGMLGSRELARRVLMNPPRLHVFGHVHASYGRRMGGLSQCFNVAVVDEDYKLVRKPAVVHIDNVLRYGRTQCAPIG